MEFGFQDKRKSLILLGLLVALAFAVIYAINNMPKDDAAGTSSRTASPTVVAKNGSQRNLTPAQRRRQQALDIYKIDPTIHVEKLAQAPTAEYTATRRNLFHYEAAPPPPPPKKTQKQIDEEKKALANRPPPPPPPPPSIDLRYYGYAMEAGSKIKKVFLTNGQDIFIATEGEIIANRYKIVRIGVNSVEVEDLQNKNRQQLPLIEG